MRARSSVLLGLACGAALFAALGASAGVTQGQARTAVDAGAARAAVSVDRTTDEKLRGLALLATGMSGTASRATACLGEGKDAESCLDEIVRSPDAAKAASEILFPMLMTPGSFGFDEVAVRIVTRTKDGVPVYGIQGACNAADAAAVHPWWNMASTLLVCPDSYQPDHVFDKNTHARCGSTEGRPDFSRDCGCGVNLLYCAAPGQVGEMYGAWQAEVRDTVAAVITADRPLKDIFTMNETVRSPIVEWRYRRARIANGADPDKVMAEPIWSGYEARPRVEIMPGHHAGILTTPQAIFRESGFRERVQLYSKMLWCIEPTSAQVATSAVFDLGTADFRHGKGWESLVARPVCNGCHARIDWGLQFFSGYSWAPKAADFLLSERDRPTSYVYINGPDDQRGEGPATPLDFAKIAIAQPEVGRCLSTRIVERVLGDSATSADVQAVRAAYAKEGTYRALLRAALAARLGKTFEASAAGPVPSPAVAPAHAAGDGDWEHATVRMSPDVRALVDSNCMDCHDEGERDFRGATFAIPRVLKMISRVGSRSMPPGTASLTTEERRALVGGLVGMLPFDDAEKTTLREFHLGAAEAPVMRPDRVLIETISERTQPGFHLGGNIVPPPPGWLSLGTDGEIRETPGEVTAIGVAALKACERAKADSGCLERAMSTRGLTFDEP